jgi:hypothetical protein
MDNNSQTKVKDQVPDERPTHREWSACDNEVDDMDTGDLEARLMS